MWFLEDKARFAEERRALHDLAREPWLTSCEWRIDIDSGRLCVDVDLAIGNVVRPLAVLYPKLFPFAPPSVVPRGATERWSIHQFGPGGELCLELRPDNWEPVFGGADMIRSAHRLLASESGELGKVAAQVPSAHVTTLGQDMRAKWLRLVVTESFSRKVESCVRATPFKFRFLVTGAAASILPTRVVEGGVETWLDPEIPSSLGKFDTGEGFAVHLETADRRLGALSEAVAGGALALRSLLFERGDAPFSRDEVLVVKAPKATRAFYLDADTGSATECGVIHSVHADRLSADAEGLARLRFAIVGCGSVGSKVASMLARSGVRDFLLVDDDILLPGNLVRNELDWRSVGAHKVDAVAERLQLIHPNARSEVVRQQVGGQESSSALVAVLAKLSCCDFIVDASASDDAFNYLASVAERHAKPMAWGRVFAGGFGGYIARSRPGLDPTPQQARAAIHAFCSDPKFPPPPVTVAAYAASRADNVPMVANDADVSTIAARLAAIVLDTAFPTQGASTFEQSAYMVGFRKEWIFEAAFDTWPIDLGQPRTAPRSALADEDEADVDRALLELLTPASETARG